MGTYSWGNKDPKGLSDLPQQAELEPGRRHPGFPSPCPVASPREPQVSREEAKQKLRLPVGIRGKGACLCPAAVHSSALPPREPLLDPRHSAGRLQSATATQPAEFTDA